MRIKRLLAAVVLSACMTVSPLIAKESLERDLSQRVYERKVQLQLSDMGLKANSATLPVKFCPHKKDCATFGKWKFPINKALEKKATDILLKRLSGMRYDILSLEADKLTLKTLSETIDTPTQISSFTYQTGSYSDFRSSVGDYLEQHLAPIMSDVLAKAKDARYQEMKDKEKGTFLETIAKEQSVPARFIERLMNSAYVFSVYLERARGSVDISEIERKKKNKINLVFDTKVSVSLTAQLLVHRYNADTGKFEFYKTISGGSGSVSASSVVFPSRPGIQKVQALFDESFLVATKAAGIAANIDVVDDDNFSIFASISQVNSPRFRSTIGENEDLRIDAPYEIIQYVDGKQKKAGFAKSRSSATRKTFKNEPGEYSSEFYLIRGNMEIGDQLQEHPWSGFLWFVDTGSTVMNIDSIKLDDQELIDSGGGSFYGIRLGAKADLGFFLNKPSFSERWLELQASVSGGGEDLSLGDKAEYEPTVLVTAGIDMVHRQHAGTFGFYWAYKYGLAVAYLDTSAINDPNDTADDISLTSFGADLGLQFGFVKSPNVEIYTNVGTFVPFSTTAKRGDTKLDAEVSNGIDFEDFGFDSLNIAIGFAWHSKKVGGFARLMK